MGAKALRQLQLAQEATMGVAAVPTAIWRGTGVLEDIRDPEVVEEDVGILVPPTRSYIPALAAKLDMPSIEATFEQLTYLLSAGVKDVAGVQDGAGTDYIWTYPFATTTKNTPQSYTIRGGDDTEVEEMEYSLISKLTLEGEFGKAWMMSAEWFGRQVTGGKSFASLSLQAVEEILFSKTALYIDSDTDGFGTTPITATLRKAKLDITTGYIPLPVAGNLYFGVHGAVKPEIMLDLEFEWNSNAVTEKGHQRTQTERAIRLLCEGSDVGTPGTTYSAKTLIIDIPGRWQKFTPLGESDGNNIVTATLKGGYNTVLASSGEIVVVNESSTLT